jgi:hypothetical protein
MYLTTRYLQLFGTERMTFHSAETDTPFESLELNFILIIII